MSQVLNLPSLVPNLVCTPSALDKVQALLPNCVLWPKENESEGPVNFKLDYQDSGLHLYFYSSNTKSKPLVLNIDLAHQYYLLKNLSGPFLRALGKKRGQAIDATAGLLADSVFMLKAGLAVTAFEAHPLIYLLGQEAIERSKLPITLSLANAAEKIQHLFADVIFVDPMFLVEQKSASPAPKKEMQIFQALLGPTTEAESQLLLKAALQSNSLRVLVKRPRLGKSILEGVKQTFAGKSVRYDLYIPKEYK